VLAQGDWWHIVPSAVLTCLLPDIDHPKSFPRTTPEVGVETHRPRVRPPGFTHSLLAVFGLLTLFYLKVPESWIVPADAIQGMVLGYLSHILADMLTPAGVPLLWPCRWRFRFPILAPQKGNQLERVLCMALFAYAVWMPQTLPENSAVRWSSQMINSLQFQFNRFIHHQIEQ
jgi:inner membrane protein